MPKSYQHWNLEECQKMVGPGWRDLITVAFSLCNSEKSTILQIKEKWGGLRIYINSGSEELYSALDYLEALSRKVCEFCGKAGKIRETSWVKTLCDEDLKKYKSGVFDF